MFCPKCGTQNPEDGKFCRSCGTDLASVSAALTGALPAHLADAGVAQIHHEARRRNDPNEVYADAVKAIISGIGFLVVSMVLLFTGVAGGYAWWWAMLFPAFTFLSKGISDYVKYGKMQSTSKIHAADLNMMGAGRANSALPPTQTEYIAPSESSYKTGDLVPPSVTDGTTRHLEMDPEGKTMTLPKR
jgi:hypothetical protein